MDDLDTLLAEGKITASEYATRLLKQQEHSTEAIDLELGRQESLKSNLGTDPNLLPDSGVQYQMNISPEEMETYTSRGITPNTYTDYVDQRAQLQTTADKWGNGVAKMLGKAATATAGGVGMLGSVAINVAGQVEDLWAGDNTSFHEIYDNAFFTALDNANKAMDDALPHYVTKAREDDSLLQSLGSANFWSNDFLQGASFVVGAIATEGLIGVASKGLGVTSRMNNITKTLNSVENATASGASKLFGKSSILQSGKEATVLARQMVTSAGYESAVEANSFVQDAKAQWVLDYQETHRDSFGNPIEPPAEELAKAMKEIYSVGNGVFGTNLIVTGLTQAKTLPGMFSPKLGKLLGSTDNIAKDAKKMVETATLTNKQLTRAAKRMKISVEELRKIPNIAKEVAYTKLGKFASRAGKGLEGAVFEGGQEGLQKAISYSAMDYLNDRFDGAKTEDIVESGIAGLSKAFGNNAESWKEIFIGALLGSAGGPGGPKGARWQGGLIEAFRDPSKSESFQKTLALANKYGTNEKGFLNNYLKHVALSTNTQDKKDSALDRGDVYDYKSQEAKEVFDYFNFMSKMGRLSEVEDRHLRDMQNMTKDEFQNSYGYENLTEEKFIQRKTELATNIKKQAKDANNARSTAASIYRGGDPDVLDGIAYSIYSNKNLDHRESTMAQEISTLLGRAIPNNLRDVSDMPNLEEVARLKLNIESLENARVDPVSDQARLDQLEKLNKQMDKLLSDNYDKQQKINKRDTATAKVDYRTSADFATYRASVLSQVDALNEIATDENLDPIQKAEIEKKLEDLKRIANERKQYVGDFNRLLTKRGIDELENQVSSLRQEYLDEEIDLRTNTILEARRKADPSEQIYRAQEEAFRAKAGNVNFALDIIGKMAETKEQLDEIDTIIQGLELKDQEKLDTIKAWFAKFHQALALYDTLPNEEAKKKFLEENLKPAITELKFNLLNLKMTNPEDYEKLVASGMYKRLTTLLASLGVNPANTSTSLTPVNSDPRQLQTMTWIPEDSPAYTPEVTAIRNNATDIDDHVSFRIVREDLIDADGNIKPDFVEPNNQVSEEMVGTGVKVAMCIPELKTMLNDTAPGVKYVVQVFYDNTHIGFLNTPNKYRFGDTMDEFNGSVEHLAMLNPRYVKTEDDGTVVASEEGKKFINIYKNAVESFNKLLNQIKPAVTGGTPKLDFTNQEVKAIYDIHFDFSGMKKDSVGLSLQELSQVANGNTVSKLEDILSAVPDDLPKEGIIIYNKNLNVYYIFDHITQEAFEIPNGYNSELNSHFSTAITNLKKNKFALSALYNINGKSLFTVIKDQEVDVPEFEAIFNQELVDDLANAAAYLNELKAAYKLNDFFTTQKGKVTNLAQLPSEFRKYRFTSYGRNYVMGYVARRDSKGEPYIELQLSVSTGNTDVFTNITLGVYNLNKEAIPYIQGSKISSTSQPFLFDDNAFLFTKNGLKYKGSIIKTPKNLIQALNKRIDDELTNQKKAKIKNPNDEYVLGHIINLSYLDPKTGEPVPAAIENIKKNISSDKTASNLNSYKTLRTPDLKVTFTKPGGVSGLVVDELESAIDRALNATSAYSERALLEAIQTLKDKFNGQNNETQNNYRIKYNNALNHVNALINRRPPTATPTTITEGRFVAKLENGVWKMYDSLGESLGLSYNTKEEAIREMKLAVLTEKIQEIVLTEENYNNFSNVRDHSDDAQFEDAFDFAIQSVDSANQRTTNPLTANDIKSILDQHKVTKNINIQNTIIPLLMELQALANPTRTTSTQAAPATQISDIEKRKSRSLSEKEWSTGPVYGLYLLQKPDGRWTSAYFKPSTTGIDAENIYGDTKEEVIAELEKRYNAELDALNGPAPSSSALGIYSTNEILSKEFEEIAEKESRLLDLLPDWVTVRDIETVKEGLSKSGFTYGMFKNAAIYLSRNAPKGTEYHEAFHAVMRVLLTDNQIIKILEEAKTRYGKPTKEQLNELRGKSGKYSNLTADQLVNLWYEEQMADDFMDYMNNKKEIEPTSFIKRMFDKIIKAIRGLFGDKDGSGVTGSVIDELFKDIAEGKFKQAPKVKQSIIPLDVEAFKLLQNKDNSFMNLESTNNIMNSVFFEALNFKSENGFLTGDEIDAIIDSIREEVHAPSNFIGMLNTMAETNPSEALRVRDNIQTMYDSMNSPINKKEIIEVILNMMSLYKFTDFDIDVDMEDDKGIELIQKSNQRVGGMDSLGNKLKQYIMFTPTISDKYGFKLSKEALEALVNDEKVPLSLRKAFINYVDGYKLHNAMERMLVNTKREDLLNKLYNLTNENVDLNAFYTRIVIDIYNDLKIELPDNYKEDILNIPITTLAKSTHFRMFAAGYNKHKVNSIINRVDKKTGESKLHRSNLNDVQDNQLKIWYSDFRGSNFMGTSRDEIEKAFTDVDDALAMINPAQFQSKVDIIKRVMRDVYKINLSDKYIKLSLFHNNAELFQNVEEGSELYAIKKLYESYKDIEYLNKEIVLAIDASIKFNVDGQLITHHFTKSKEELEKDRDEDVQNSELDSSNLGAVSSVKKLALGNSMFDASASPSTFTNVNNEKVYNHLYPNYLTTFALAVRNSMAKTNFDFIDAYDYNEGFESFKKFMFENNLASPLEDDSVLNIYYRQLRNNPILNNKNIREAFVNNFECFINDGLKSQSFSAGFKGIEFADSYAALDPRAKVLFNLNQFANLEENSIDKEVKNNNNGEITDVRLYPITWVENGGKSTQWSALVPDLSYINDLGLLNETAIASYTALLKSELERVREEYETIINGEGVVDGYNFLDISPEENAKLIETLTNPTSKEEFMKAVSKFRALKLANFEVIKDINSDLYESLIINAINGDTKFDAKAIAELVSDYHFTEFIEFLKSPDIRVISNKENMLPAYYTKDGGPDMNLLKQFFLNYFINAASLNNLLVGDLNANYKSPTDLFKRMAGLNAAGASQGFGESNIAIVDDIIVKDPLLGDIKTTDGQSEATIWWYMNQYLPTGGKWNEEIERIYAKILKLEELTPDEIVILQDTGTLLNPRKTSGYAFNFYGKTSTAVISRKETSYVSEQDREEFEREVVKLLPSSNLIYGTKAFQDQVLLVQSFYKPRRATEELHNRLNKMEQSNVDLLFFKSAVKTIKTNVQDVNAASFTFMKINNEFIREQVVTDSVKNEIIHGTQLMQLIWSEQADSTEVIFNKEKVTIGELRKSYKHLLGWRVNEGFEQLQRAILKNDKANYKILLKAFQQSIIEQGADPTLLELFNSLGEIPEYNLNNPRTLGMFEKMFMSFVSKSVFSRKTAGHKFTLRTDFGHNILRRDDSVDLKRDFGSVISRQDYDANPEAYKNTKVDRLRILTDPNNPNIKYAECKIPMQLASMLEIDENGFLTSEAAEMLGIRIPSQDKHSMLYLKVVEVLPAELGPQIIMPREVIALSGADFDIDSEFARALEHFMSNGKIISFGGYLTSDNPVGIAYDEYLESKYNSKEVKIQTDYLLKDNLEYQELTKDYERIKGALRKTDKKNKAAVAEIREIRDYVKSLIKSYKDTANENAMKYFGYPSNFTEFSDRYSGQILNNVKKFKEQKISEITPLTMEEANNHLLNIEKTFVNNEGNKSIAMTPASDKAARDFMRDFYDTIEDPLSAVDYCTPQAVIRGSNANAIGQENIGIAALANIMFQYFKDNNIEIEGLGIVDSFTTANGNRINDSVSTVVTMAVDNANEQYAIRFNLTPATQSVFVSMLMLQNEFSYVSSLMVQPALIEFAAMESFKKSPIKNKVEEGEENLGTISSLQGKYKTDDNKKYDNLFPEGITEKILKKAKLYDQKIRKGQTLNADDLTADQYKAVQEFALNEFDKYKTQTDSLYHFSRVLSLIKGLKPSVGDVITTQESLKKLGLEVKNNTIVHSDEYKEALEDKDNNDFPIDYLKIFNGNSFLKAEVLTYTRFLNMLPKFFVSRTPLALSLYDDVANNIKYMQVADSEKLTRLINGYLTTMSFKNKYDKENKLINFNDLIGDETTDSLLVDLLRKLKKSDNPLISRNEFIRFLDYDKVTYENKKNNSLNNKTTYTLKIDSFAKLTPNQSRDLANSFAQLYTSTDPLAKEFADKIIFHVLGKDLGMYKNNSYLSFIPPTILKPYINQINEMHEELLKPTPNYKAVFNMTKEELIEDFTEKYIRDINNTMSIKGGRRVVIGRMTKDAMHSAYWKLNASDKMLIEADPALAPIIEKIKTETGFTDKDYEQMCPLVFSKDNTEFEIDIFNNFFTTDETGTSKLKNPAIVRFNKNVLKKVGLFGYEIVEKDGKYYSNILFPKGLNILFDDSKKHYFRTELVRGKAIQSDNPNAGVKAVYKEVTTIGSKLIGPYAFPIADQVREAIKAGAITPAIATSTPAAAAPVINVAKPGLQRGAIQTQVVPQQVPQQAPQANVTAGPIDYINANDKLLQEVYNANKVELEQIKVNGIKQINNFQQFKTFITNNINTAKMFQKTDEATNITLNAMFKTTNYAPAVVVPAPAAPSVSNDIAEKARIYRSKMHYLTVADKLANDGIGSYEEYLKWANTVADDKLVFATENC